MVGYKSAKEIDTGKGFFSQLPSWRELITSQKQAWKAEEPKTAM